MLYEWARVLHVSHYLATLPSRSNMLVVNSGYRTPTRDAGGSRPLAIVSTGVT